MIARCAQGAEKEKKKQLAEEVDKEFDGRNTTIHPIQVQGFKWASSVVNVCDTLTGTEHASLTITAVIYTCDSKHLEQKPQLSEWKIAISQIKHLLTLGQTNKFLQFYVFYGKIRVETDVSIYNNGEIPERRRQSASSHEISHGVILISPDFKGKVCSMWSFILFPGDMTRHYAMTEKKKSVKK